MRADKPRNQSGVRDMLLSLAVVFAFIALGWAAFVPRQGASIRVIDFHASLEAAQSGSSYRLLSPEGLPSGWRPTSAYPGKEAGSFHIGFVTPAGAYAAVEQTPASPQAAVDTVLGNGSVPGETATVAGAQWELRQTAKGERALVRAAGSGTVVVTGSAQWAELQQLAASLR